MLHESGIWQRPSALFGAMAVACCVALAHPTSAGDWITDGKTGCRVWNPYPTAKESLSWSGPCRDGYAEGKGVVQWFKEGLPYERDEGTWQEGREVGRGRYGRQADMKGKFTTVSHMAMVC
jgi:hypothetical protein